MTDGPAPERRRQKIRERITAGILPARLGAEEPSLPQADQHARTGGVEFLDSQRIQQFQAIRCFGEQIEHVVGVPESPITGCQHNARPQRVVDQFGWIIVRPCCHGIGAFGALRLV